MATRFRHLLPALNRLASAGARVDLEQEGLAMSGLPFVRHTDYGPASFTVEAGVQLVEAAEPPPEDSTLSAGVIPASTVATSVLTEMNWPIA